MLGYLIMKTERWVNNIMDEYREDYYPITRLSFNDLSKIFLGIRGSSHFPGGRKTWRALWINIDSEMLPLGLFACHCSGLWKHDKEYGVLELGKQKIVLSRNGNILFIKKNNKIIGEINYGIWLRIIYFGSSTFKLPNNINGKIFLPVICDACISKDFLGCICFKNNCNVKYLIDAQNKTSQIIERNRYKFPFCSYFSNTSPVYAEESWEVLNRLCDNEDDVYVFLVIACWSQMFYTHW
jgi:hypothetical protein